MRDWEFQSAVMDYAYEHKQRAQFFEEPMQVSWIKRVNWWRVLGLALALGMFGGLVYLWAAQWLF